MGQDSAVGTATRYGLNGLIIESRWRGYFPHPSRTAIVSSQSPINGYRVSFPGVKRVGPDVDHSRAEVKERVQLYLYSPPGPSYIPQGDVYLS